MTKLIPIFVCLSFVFLTSSVDACELDGTDISGCNYLYYIVTETWEECGQLCNKHTWCKLWTWQKFWFDNAKPKCWLKDDSKCKVKWSSDEKYVSGHRGCPKDTKYQPLYGTDVVGVSTVPHATLDLKTTSWKECQKACTRSKKCKGWTWAHGRSSIKPFNCWFKESDYVWSTYAWGGMDFEKTDANFISGVTLNKNAECPLEKLTQESQITILHEKYRKKMRKQFGRIWNSMNSYVDLEWEAFSLLHKALPLIFKDPSSLWKASNLKALDLMFDAEPSMSYMNLFGTVHEVGELSQFMLGPMVRKITASIYSGKQRSKVIRAMFLLIDASIRRKCEAIRQGGGYDVHKRDYSVIGEAAIRVLAHFGISDNYWLVK